MEVTVKELYVTNTPFAVIKSEEIGETIYSLLYRDRGLKTKEISKDELNYFLTIKSKAKYIQYGYEGVVYEYFNFRNKLDQVVRHQFLEGLKYGRK